MKKLLIMGAVWAYGLTIAHAADLRPYSLSPAGGDSRYVNVTGDTMSGPLTINSTATITGNAFSVGVSTLVVAGGNVGIGTTAPAAKLHTIGEVRASSATTSGASICLAGAFDTLPTTGFAKGCLAFLTSDPTKIYLSTEAVVGVQSWLGK